VAATDVQQRNNIPQQIPQKQGENKWQTAVKA
jgi:hypothetical protein